MTVVLRTWLTSKEVVIREVFPESSAVFLVEGRPDGRPLGLLTMYDVDRLNRYSYVSVAKFGEAFSRRFLLGAALWTDYLFEVHEFRKLYAQATESSLSQFLSGLDKLFVVEGILQAHSWVNDRYENQYVLACSRERWAREGRLLTRHLLQRDVRRLHLGETE